MVAIVLKDKPNDGTEFRYGLETKSVPVKEPGPDEALIKIQGAALNHRDLWILKGAWANTQFGDTVCSDAVAIVVKCPDNSLKPGTRVLVNPGYGWDSDEQGPEGEYGILGLRPYTGTMADRMVVKTKDLVPCPEHMSLAEAAALPLAGLTAYRALFTKCKARPGDHILITGIGGGVALYVLQFAVAAGINAFVTSGSQEKIEQAKKLGAKGGVNYKNANCIEELKKLLNGKPLVAIVDGAGGELYEKYPEVLKPGGIIANYGRTATQPTDFNWGLILNNIDLKGSTMGSRRELREMVSFVGKHKIRPIIHMVFKGLSVDNVLKAATEMSHQKQFGKLVIEIDPSDNPTLPAQ